VLGKIGLLEAGVKHMKQPIHQIQSFEKTVRVPTVICGRKPNESLNWETEG
jgi:hypothetical protein